VELSRVFEVSLDRGRNDHFAIERAEESEAINLMEVG